MIEFLLFLIGGVIITACVCDCILERRIINLGKRVDELERRAVTFEDVK